MKEFRKWVHENRADMERKGYGKKLQNGRYDGSVYTSYGLAFPRRLLDEGNYPWVSRLDIDLRAIT